MRRNEIEGYEKLEELAYDLIWSWDHRADKIWKLLDPDLWFLTRNPLVLLQTVSTEKLKKLLEDPAFAKTVEELWEVDEKAQIQMGSWFQKKYPNAPLTCAAYFSMEFMISENLPIYSGGLGNVAGDQLKAVNDLGIPVVGVGLLYQQGYFRQVIGKDGAQQAFYPYNSPEQLPIRPVRLENGEWLRIEISLPGWKLKLRAWEAHVGKMKLYLLDTNDAVNFPPYRTITGELYGGDAENRLKQEIVLGIGGWRLLTALGIKPEVCHLNEGHAAFAILERASQYQKETGASFELALAATRAGNLFTTHTAVAAGFDWFEAGVMEKFFGLYATQNLKISFQELFALGQENGEGPFNMAYFAIRASNAVNGVSALHGKVSRQIFSPLFPRHPINEVPIGHVTNGVHARSWDSVAADDLWTEACGKGSWLKETETLTELIRKVPDARIWKMRNEARKDMIEGGRSIISRIWAARGVPDKEVEIARTIFDIHTLTLGFARRFATYKRPNMLLHDPARLTKILTNQERPVQLILSGKAHPADKAGQALIQQWMKFIWRPEIRSHVFFVQDYDMQVTERLVRGVDLWINTPRRPWEACGTSGMKILVNGGLNLSELDGWWAEAYSPQVGWAIGDRNEHGDDPAWDQKEANQLYDLLENEIIPEFYNRNKEGIPTAWVARVRESMAKLTPHYSANRSVRDYTEKFYLPMAQNYRNRTANQGKLAKQIVEWKQAIEKNWFKVRFSAIKLQSQNGQHLFEARVFLNGLSPDAVKLELFANGDPPEKQEMKMVQELEDNNYLYRAQIPVKGPIEEYTPRVVPFFEGVVPVLEDKHILWEK